MKTTDVDEVPADFRCELAIAFSGLVAPKKKCRSPLDQQSYGAVIVKTEQEVAKHILRASSADVGLETHCFLQQVTIQVLQYIDLDLHRVAVSGIIEQHSHTVEIMAADVEPPAAKRKRKRHKWDLCSDLLEGG